MPDCVLIQDNHAHEIWRNTSKSNLVARYSPEILENVVETSDLVNVGYLWTGTQFTPPVQVIVTNATGEFKDDLGEFVWSMSALPSPMAGYSVVSLLTVPTPRTQKWNGSAVIEKTQTEIDAYDAAELAKKCVSEFDGGRMFNAVVWALIDRISYPCTVTKFNNSREKILEAYKAQPWKA